MKRVALPIAAFVLAQSASVALLVLWIVQHSLEPSHVWWMIQGILLSLVIILGATTLFIFWTKSRNLDAERVNFISSISHELLTPLASLRLYVETMQLHQLDDETRKVFLERMHNDSLRLAGSISSLLSAGRIEQGRAIYQFEHHDLTDLINECIEANPEYQGKANIELQLESNSFMKADKAAMLSVLQNVFDNAIRYSPSPARIKVSLKRQLKRLRLEISDNGEGIPESELSRVFKLFYRHSSKPQGSGLGLYIVHKIVRAHRGKVWAESKGKGEGTSIVMLFKADGPKEHHRNEKE